MIYWECLDSFVKYNPKLPGYNFLRTLEGWVTPEIPTGPETSPVDTTPLPIFFVTRHDVEHQLLNLLGVSLGYSASGYLTTMAKYVGTHT